jgi:shikimate dehydrogenase/3-dehydroquinate dehydratase type I
MTDLRPRIVATLASRSARDAAPEIVRAQAEGADLAEIRLDRWNPDERARIGELFPSPLPLMATLRSRAEGGEGPDDARERSAILTRAAQLPFEAIDLEAARDLALAQNGGVSSVPVRVISAHLPSGTTAEQVAGALRREATNGSVQKVVVPATVTRALRELLPAVPPAEEGARLLMTTGPSGALFRAWSYRLGFTLVFARLAEPAASETARSAPVESSQLPVDRMRAFFDGGPSAPIFGVVGHPIDHTQSPHLHSRWMRDASLSGLYVPLDIESETEFIESLPALAARGFRGLNVTHPWKSVALAAASRVERAAQICAVANCLTFHGDEIEAENTDLAAILRRLDEYRAAGRWDGDEIAVVGAGGSAAATLAAAREVGATAYVVARDPERAKETAARFDAEVLPTAAARPFSLVVHATPVGRADAGTLESPLRSLLQPGGTLLDWVYAPERSDLRDLAGASSVEYEDGWTLLVYQAAASFGLWWGSEPSPDQVTATIQEGPCAA